MIAAKWFDMVVGVDIHIVLVPTPAGPVPTPLPHPFFGLVFDPGGLVVGTAISAGIAAFTGMFAGPVLINNLPVANTGTEGTNKLIMPHFPMPPGTAWAPIPAAPKPPVPGKPADPPAPTPTPSNDTVLITGSKTVHIGGSNACRLGDLSMDCAEPVRLPTATVIAIPMGPPVLVGGPPALDLLAAALGAIRTKWMTGQARRLLGAADGSWRSKLICMLTGHPVDVVSGMVLTDAVDFELPGPVPFRFERTYYSKASGRAGPLGHGWSHAYDQRLRVQSGRIVLEAADGRELYFKAVAPGQDTRNEAEELVLARGQAEIRIRDRDLLTHVFVPAAGGGEVWPLVAIEDPRGNRIVFRYDQYGRLVQATDSAGRQVLFVNDEQGRIRTIRLPHPERPLEAIDAVRFEYDLAGDLVSASDALGHACRYAYSHHLLVQETAANGLSFFFAYDGITPDARCVHTWGDGGIFDHVLTYDTARGVTLKEDSYGNRTLYFANRAQLVERMIDTLGRERTFAYDDALHRVVETDSAGAPLTMTYDRRGNLTTLVDADGVAREYEFDDWRQPVRERVGEANEQHYRYNRFAELESAHNVVGGGIDIEFNAVGDPVRLRSRSGRTANLAWDEHRNLVQAELPGELPVGARYDALGRCTGVDLPDGRSIHYQLDLAGRTLALTRSWLGTEHFEYDAAGLLTRRHDSGGGEVVYEYGNYNRITAMRSAAGHERRFEYDREGDLVAIRNESGETWRLERDSEGQITRETDFSGRVREYAYDKAGNISEIREAGGKRTGLQWTPGGRLLEMKYPDGSFDRFAYDGSGRVVQAENETGVLQREYDALGRLASETWAEFRIGHEYDLDNLRVRSATADGLTLDYTWDAGERLTRVRVNDRYDVERSYDAFGRLTEVRSPGGIVQALHYDEHGQLRRQQVRHLRRGVLAHRHYEFNPAGALAAIYDAARGLKTYAFGPGGVERVLRDGEVTEAYSYSPAGEWLPAPGGGRLGQGGRVERFGQFRYDHDGLGRVVAKSGPDGTWRYQYNDRGQLTAVTSPDGEATVYEYDPFWRRVRSRSTRETVEWRWNGDTPIREERTSGSGPVRRRTFIHEPDGYLPLLVLAGERVLTVVGDQVGTPQEVIAADGEVVWAADYSVWGRLVRQRSSGYVHPQRFPGQWWDEESGLHYNRFRYYDPDCGRYLTPDPTGLQGGLNLYAYPGDPLTVTDPTGLSCVRTYVSSWMIFFRSGIRPKHARALMRHAMETGQTLAFRNIGTFRKRVGAMIAGLFGMRPKPMTTKAKSNAVGIATDPVTGQRFRSDYDPTFYRNPDGSVMTDAEAAAANADINRALGGDEIQHPTHVTMPADDAAKVGPPGNTTVFHPDGSTSQTTNQQMADSPDIPWQW